MKSQRKAVIKRKTKETEIKVSINLDGKGQYKISTGIPFFDHMLILLSKHSSFDLDILAKGDSKVDDHHLVEDVGICFGEVIKKSLKEKIGIKRFASCILPMDETLVLVSLDISNRFLLVIKPPFTKSKKREFFQKGIKYSLKIKEFDVSLVEHFLNSLVCHAGLTLHINILYGENLHHIIEAIFKGVAVVLKEAVKIEKKIKEVPSTKGIL